MNEFWKTRKLAEMTAEEWELLCDGCAQCCLVKLEDVDSGEVYYTDVVCSLLDQNACRCTAYTERCTLVPDCVQLTPDNLANLSWMPQSCAYRRLAEGRGLAEWHPLVSGSAETVHLAGVSVRHRAISEKEVDPDNLEEHIIDLL
jgi:uncharacterized cysteine cluster protein YcgN (CxxCxxCC family)